MLKRVNHPSARFAAILAAVVALLAVRAPAEEPLLFDGERAMELLRRQCEFGPRVPGTGAHERAGDFLADQLRASGWEPMDQAFTARPALLGNRPTLLRNIIAARLVEGRPSVLISAHWDTRPIAEMDPDPILARQPILGANDGASGTAVVLELARVFTEQPTSCGIVLALVDGEDLGTETIRHDWCLGSKHLADRLNPAWRIEAAINVDMVGQKNVRFTEELYGKAMAPEFHDFCWRTGAGMAPAAFSGQDRRAVFDDHISFLRKGIPAFNLIAFTYPYWHTHADTVDKCSPESLELAGRVVERIVRRLGEKARWDFSVGDLPEGLRRW